MSLTIQTVTWIVPTVQTIHILAIAAVMSSVLMLNLRLIGVLGRDEPLPRFFSRFLPVIWWSLPVLLVTGAIMIVGEPVRSLENPVFQLKMCLVIAAIVLTLGYELWLRSKARAPTAVAPRRGAASVVVLASFGLWIGIVFAGRWIAYF